MSAVGMKSHAAKLAFGLIWLVLFFELLFDAEIRQAAFSFCVQRPLLAPLILVASQLLLASFALPCGPLTALAGVLWGGEVGILYSTIATLVSSLWTFFLGRFVIKRRWRRKIQPGWWSNISGLIARYNWKASMIAHANPVFPGSSLGYAFGYSDISGVSFFLGALIGTLPLQILMVGLGHFTAQTINTYDVKLMIAAIVLVIAIVGYMIFMPRFFSRNKEESR